MSSKEREERGGGRKEGFRVSAALSSFVIVLIHVCVILCYVVRSSMVKHVQVRGEVSFPLVQGSILFEQKCSTVE